MSDKIGAMGRSWHRDAKDTREGAVNLGLNFDEQWKRVMEVNPKFVFVTGWNEWIAGRYTRWSKYTDADCYFPGGLFVDEYTQEYSRDCEPMRGRPYGQLLLPARRVGPALQRRSSPARRQWPARYRD